MSSTYIGADLRRLVVARAGGICEYCLISEDDAYFGCEVDHIIGEKHGGPTEADNLAVACVFCNQGKGSDIGSIYWGTGQFVRFFNPRNDLWADHFELAGARIEAKTAIGVVTARILDFNNSERLLEREELRSIKRYPSPKALQHIGDRQLITQWFANDGGPLLAVDLADAAGWRGSGEYVDGKIQEGSDYTRACAAAYPAGRVDVGKTWGVVIGAQEGVAVAGWWALPGSDRYFLMGCVYGDEGVEHRVAALLATDVDIKWTELGLLRIDSGRLMLLHAAAHGGEVVVDPQRNKAFIGEALTVAVPCAEYAVAAAEVKIKDAGLYCVVRWARRIASD